MAKINMQKYSKEKLLLGLATRLETNPKFMANVLRKYRKQEKLSREQIIQKFEMSQEQFAQLALCKCPDAESENFATQVHEIAILIKLADKGLLLLATLATGGYMSRGSKIHLSPGQFQKYMDAMTKWQRIAILMDIKLSQLGHGDEARRLMKLNKFQAEEELLRWQNAAGVAPDEP